MIKSKKIITNFLQTVVIIDDEAFLDEELYRKHEELSAQYIACVKASMPKVINRGKSSSGDENKPQDERQEEVPHYLNAKVLSDTFADYGLMCTVLRPTIDTDFSVKYNAILKKADIVILDWKLKEGDNGSTVKGLIKEVIKDSDGNTQKSLRSIVIYSGESKLKDKLQSVKEDLQSELGSPTAESDFSLEYDRLQIKIYAKEATQRAPKDTDVLKNETTLVTAIIDDFVSQVAGLVPNMAIQSLAELRQNTHKILGVFSKELDEAYLSHRMMLPNSSDAESFMINILISELEAVLLNSTDITKSINIESIMNWLDDKFEDSRYRRLLLNEFILTKNDDKLEAAKAYFSYPETIQILKNGTNLLELLDQKLLSDKEKIKDLVKKMFTDNLEKSQCKLLKQSDSKSKTKHKKLRELSKFLYKNDDDALKREHKFTALSTIKTIYSNPTPYLTLGSILKNTEGKYFLCIIPRCDAVRKKTADHSYPFLSLEDATDKFSLLIEDAEYKKLTISDKPEELLTITLRKTDSNEDEPLYAEEDGVNRVFRANNGDVFVWITELKREKAQSILKSFADKLSRVGFNESEYLRRAYQ